MNRLISRHDTAEERISGVQETSRETSKTEKAKRTKMENNKTNYPRTVGQP